MLALPSAIKVRGAPPGPQVHGDISSLVMGTSKYQGAKASRGNQDLPGTGDHSVKRSQRSDTAHIYAHAQRCRELRSLSSLRPSDRKELPALPASGSPVVASVMSWVQAASLVQGPEEEGDVFDEEADESLLVQREWQSHMQRRVKVKLRGEGGGPLLYRVVSAGAGSCEKVGSQDEGRSGRDLAWRCPPSPVPFSLAHVLLEFPSGLLETVLHHRMLSSSARGVCWMDTGDRKI